uniref:Uncharacterized protein n=1 Tax=Onchocerca volvulus TaxID=6282 RepID=A0A2K6WJM9_ONCVO
MVANCEANKSTSICYPKHFDLEERMNCIFSTAIKYPLTVLKWKDSSREIAREYSSTAYSNQ